MSGGGDLKSNQGVPLKVHWKECTLKKFWAHIMALVKAFGRSVSGRWLKRWTMSTSYEVAKGYPKRYFGRNVLSQKILGT